MANIFPDIIIPQAVTTESQPITYGKELAFDFAIGEFILENGKPKVVTGIEALKVWIEKTIRTARYRFPIYTFQYGCELEDIVGYDIPRMVMETEVQRAIRESLIYDSRIIEVRDFVVERGGDWLKVTFRVVTALGDTFQQEVST